MKKNALETFMAPPPNKILGFFSYLKKLGTRLLGLIIGTFGRRPKLRYTIIGTDYWDFRPKAEITVQGYWDILLGLRPKAENFWD